MAGRPSTRHVCTRNLVGEPEKVYDRRARSGRVLPTPDHGMETLRPASLEREARRPSLRETHRSAVMPPELPALLEPRWLDVPPPVPLGVVAPGAPPPAALLRVSSPLPALRAYVRSYLYVEQRDAEIAHTSALASPVLSVTWGGPVRVTTGPDGDRLFPLVALSGASTHGHRMEIGAGVRGFHVRLCLAGAQALLREHATPDSWHDGLPAAFERWADAIVEADSFEARVALTDAFLCARLPTCDVWSSAASGLVERTAGSLSVHALSETLGVSDRTLRRRFHDDTGLGVKTFAQIERYRQAHGYLLRTPGTTWRDVCERYGYADQAHFVRAFHRFTGETPTHWQSDGHVLDIGMGLRDEGA